MTDEFDKTFALTHRPTAARPLAGLTVLMVEDSRFASEAVRLLCLRSGARLRRADSLRAAERHLAVYRPSAIIVDLGLPDGNGLDLIARLHAAEPRIPAILATSGDDAALAQAQGAGADALLAKPLASLGSFQETLLAALPGAYRPAGPRAVAEDRVAPDRIALIEDLARVADVLSNGEDEEKLGYAARFLTGVARTAEDESLERAARELEHRRAAGEPVLSEMAQVAGLLQDRLDRRAVV